MFSYITRRTLSIGFREEEHPQGVSTEFKIKQSKSNCNEEMSVNFLELRR